MYVFYILDDGRRFSKELASILREVEKWDKTTHMVQISRNDCGILEFLYIERKIDKLPALYDGNQFITDINDILHKIFFILSKFCNECTTLSIEELKEFLSKN